MTTGAVRKIVIFLLSTLNRFSQGSFYISNEESTWCNASSVCTLGTPDIKYTSETYYAEIDGIELRGNETVWTGFYLTVQILEYFDCINVEKVGDSNATSASVDIDGSLNNCLAKCGNSHYIGVTYHKCFCINQAYIGFKQTSRHTECTTQCSFPSGIACGFENDTDIFLSVYHLNGHDSNFEEKIFEKDNEIQGRSCLALNYDNFKWEHCNQSHHVICYTDHKAVAKFTTSSWLEAANSCFREKLIPTSLNNSRTVDKNDFTDLLWTGVVRLTMINRVDENFKEEDDKEIKFGVLSLEPSTDKYSLSFKKDVGRRRILCEECKQYSNTFPVVPVLIALAVVILITSTVAIVFISRRKRKGQIQAVRQMAPSEPSSLIAASSVEQKYHAYFVVESHEKEEENCQILHMNQT